MSQELTSYNQEKINEINKLSGITPNNPTPPQIKFNSTTGEFEIEDGKDEATNKTKFRAIGEKIDVQIARVRTMVQSFGDNAIWSRESDVDNFKLYNSDKQLVMQGQYKEVKAWNPELKYIKVLYVYYNDQLHRIKLGGAKLSSLFNYLNTFAQDAPARYITELSRGAIATKGAVNYFELNIARGNELPADKVIESLQEVNQYINAYESNRDSGESSPTNKESVNALQLEEAPLPEEHPIF